MTDEQRIKLVEMSLDGSINRCKAEDEYRKISCTEPSFRFWRDPEDGSIWMPCMNHLGQYVNSDWKEIK
jgi:hypothetical protein